MTTDTRCGMCLQPISAPGCISLKGMNIRPSNAGITTDGERTDILVVPFLQHRAMVTTQGFYSAGYLTAAARSAASVAAQWLPAKEALTSAAGPFG